LLDKFVPVHYGNIRRLLGDLTDHEKQMLIKLLKKTRASLVANSEELAQRSGVQASMSE